MKNNKKIATELEIKEFLKKFGCIDVDAKLFEKELALTEDLQEVDTNGYEHPDFPQPSTPPLEIDMFEIYYTDCKIGDYCDIFKDGDYYYEHDGLDLSGDKDVFDRVSEHFLDGLNNNELYNKIGFLSKFYIDNFNIGR